MVFSTKDRYANVCGRSSVPRTGMDPDPGVTRTGADSPAGPPVDRRHSHHDPRSSDGSPDRPEMSARSVCDSVSEVPCFLAARWESIGPARLPSSGDSSFHTAPPVHHTQDTITAVQHSVELENKTTKASTALELYALSIVQEAISSAANHLKDSKPLNSRNLDKISESEDAEGQESQANQDAKEATDDNFCDTSTLTDVRELRDVTMTDPTAGSDISCRNASQSHHLLTGDVVDKHALLSSRGHRPTSPTNTDGISPGPAKLAITPSTELTVSGHGDSSPPADTATPSHEASCPLYSDVPGYTGTKRLSSSKSEGDGVTLSLHSRVMENGKRESCAAEDEEFSIQSETPVEHNSEASGTADVQSDDVFSESASAANERDRIRRLRLAVETLVDEFRLEKELEALLKPRTSSAFATNETNVEMIRGVQSDMMEMLPPGAEESRAFYDEIRSILDSVKSKRRVGDAQVGGNSVEKETSEFVKSSPLSKVKSTLVGEVSNYVDSHLITGASKEQRFEENIDLSDSLADSPEQDTPVTTCYDSFMETIPLISEDEDSQDDDVVVTTGTPEQVRTFDPWTAAVHDSKTTRELHTSGEDSNGGTNLGKVIENTFKEVELSGSSIEQTEFIVAKSRQMSVDKFCESQSMEANERDMMNQVSSCDRYSKEDSERTTVPIVVHVTRKDAANHSEENHLTEETAITVIAAEGTEKIDLMNNQTAGMADRNNTGSVERDQQSSQTRPQTADTSVERDQQSSQTRPQTADMSVERDQQSSQTRPQTADTSVERDQQSSQTRPQTADTSVERDQQSSQTRPQTADTSVERDQQSSQTRPQTADTSVERDQQSSQTRPQTTDMSEERDQQSSQIRPQTADTSVERDQQSSQTRPQTTDMSEERDQQSSQTRPQTADTSEERDQQSSQIRPQTADMSEERDQQSSQTRPQTADTSEERDQQSSQTRPQTADMSEERDQQSSQTRPQTADTSEERDQQSSQTRPQTADTSVERDQQSSQTRPQTADTSEERDQQSSQTRPQTADTSEERDQQSSQTRPQAADTSVERDQQSSQTRPQTADMSVERDQQSSQTRPQTADTSEERDQQSSQTRTQTADMSVERDQQSSQTRPQTRVPGRVRRSSQSPECHHKLTSAEDIVFDIQEKLDEGGEGDSSERDSPKPVSASRSHRQVELIQAESCASSEGKMMVRSRHSSGSPEAHRRSPLAVEDGGPFREEDVDRGSLGQNTDVVSEEETDSLPLLLDTDKLLPQMFDEQISPNTVVKSMSDLREGRFMAVRDYRRSYMDREPILYRGDIVTACRTPHLPCYSLTSVDVLTFVPESYLRPLDLDD
ncbi:hypothetical protein Bbelb_310530 [Branchiostoma belcheri]|nr:hypothetical protein Bbelb_310530 [Branchiostoma belcheri]